MYLCLAVVPQAKPRHIKPVHNSQAFSPVVYSADCLVACRVGALSGLSSLFGDKARWPAGGGGMGGDVLHLHDFRTTIAGT